MDTEADDITPTWEYDDEARCREHYEHDCPLCKDKFGSED